jgi:hypothetical protein
MPAQQLDVTGNWDSIRRHLPVEYAEKARELKQLQVQYGNAKIRTADDLLRLILLHAGADLPLRQTVSIMAEAGGPVVSHVRLHKRLSQSVPYLRWLVASMSDTAWVNPERWSGYDVISIDATAVCSPGAENTDARLHVQLRLAGLEPLAVKVEGVAVGESFKRFTWAPGQLAVGDRGYSHPPGIRAVVNDGADVLVRVARGSLPLEDEDGHTVALMTWLRGLAGHDAHEQLVSMVDKKTDTRVQGRLVAMRLPAAQAEKARARLKRELGSKVKPEDREAAAYVVLFTTTPSSKLNATRCLELYRVRWQIELLFKRWKSLCGLERLPNYLDTTVLAWLHAKVLLALLMERMATSALSPPAHPEHPTGERRSAVDTPAVEARLDSLAQHRRRTSPSHAA